MVDLGLMCQTHFTYVGFKAPKQFKHWAERYGFRRRTMRKMKGDYNFHGPNGRHLRLVRKITTDGADYMQICDGDFDRWANSVGNEVSMPKNRTEFEKAMEIFGIKARR